MGPNLRPVQSILIVGGGSAGWTTANLLQAYLNRDADPSEHVSITVLEAPDIPSIGVGEATVPTIRGTLMRIGLGEKELMRATDATFKSAIRFKDWTPEGEFDHPFDRRSRANTDEDLSAWLGLGRDGRDFAKQFSLLSNLCDFGLAPKGIDWPDYQSAFPYAYHLDAVKLASLLTETGIASGITQILGRVTNMTRTESGEISELHTEDGAAHRADLYIDCTGFSARLISALEPSCFDYSETLLCDRAIAVQVPFELFKPGPVLPFTTATARRAGWNWDIHLQNRRGVGYVYSSAFQSEAEALSELLAFEGPHIDSLNVRAIAFEPFKRQRSWVKNCVAIGLSDGFIEPLESSGLFMIEFAAHLLGTRLQANRAYSSSTVRQFNRVMQSLAEEVVDYVSLHYQTSTRTDTEFWREARRVDRARDGLQDLLQEWSCRSIRDTDLLSLNRLFSLESYEYLLFGTGYTQIAKPEVQKSFTYSIAGELDRCLNTLPTHEDWLQRLQGRAA